MFVRKFADWIQFANGTKFSRTGQNVRERAAFADGTEHIQSHPLRPNNCKTREKEVGIQLTLKNCQEGENEVISGQTEMFALMHDLGASAQFYACTHIFQTTLSIHAGYELCTCKRDA